MTRAIESDFSPLRNPPRVQLNEGWYYTTPVTPCSRDFSHGLHDEVWNLALAYEVHDKRARSI
jgi:hypothetical protein